MDRRDAYRVLASADRQLVLHELLDGEESVGVDELARQVAARRHRLRPRRVSEDQLSRARVRLVHVHLPLLAERELVADDWPDGTVTLAEGANLERVLDAGDRLETWPPDDLLAPSEA